MIAASLRQAGCPLFDPLVDEIMPDRLPDSEYGKPHTRIRHLMRRAVKMG
jgi:hypothetical protein